MINLNLLGIIKNPTFVTQIHRVGYFAHIDFLSRSSSLSYKHGNKSVPILAENATHFKRKTRKPGQSPKRGSPHGLRIQRASQPGLSRQRAQSRCPKPRHSVAHLREHFSKQTTPIVNIYVFLFQEEHTPYKSCCKLPTIWPFKFEIACKIHFDHMFQTLSNT